MSEAITALALLLILVLCGCVGYSAGTDSMKWHMQREAVKAGSAKWVTTTQEDGSWSTKFEWVTPTEKKEK